MAGHDQCPLTLSEEIGGSRLAETGLLKMIGVARRRGDGEPFPCVASVICRLEENVATKFKWALAGHPAMLAIDEGDCCAVACCHAIWRICLDFPGIAAVLRPQ